MEHQRTYHRSSVVALRYWILVSLLAWGALSVVGLVWHPLRPTGATTILFATSAGCFANWSRNRTCHCAISGPLLLIAGAVFLLSDLRIIDLRPGLVWVPLLIGLGIAFLVEWRFARTPRVK